MQKAGLAQSKVRFYLLPKAQLEKQPAKALPGTSPVQLSSDKTSSNERYSATQANKSAHSQPEKLARDKNLDLAQTNAIDTYDRKQLKRYFNSAEVDQPALPVDDWNFSLNHLNPALTYTLQLEIYLSSDGTVDDWVVLKQEPEGDWVEQVVEKLKSTILMPATKEGLPVNMVRTIEIFIKP